MSDTYSDNSSMEDGDSASHHDHDENTNNNNNHNNNLAEDNHQNRFVITLVRSVVFLVLILATITTIHATYSSSRKAEVAAFEDAFEGVAKKLAPGMVNDLTLLVRSTT